MRQTDMLEPRSVNMGNLAQLPGPMLALGGVWLLLLGALAVGLYRDPERTVSLLLLIGLGIPAAVLVWKRPEFGVLAVVFLASSFVRRDIFDVRLPVGGLDVRDLALLGMLGLLAVKQLTRLNLTFPWWPVSRWLLVFLGLAIFSALYAVLYRDVQPKLVLNELRPLMYYTTFFVVAWAIVERKQFVMLLAGLFILADITVLVVILQQFYGRENPLLAAMIGGAWRVYQAEGQAGGFGAVRILPPGHIQIYLMSIVAFCLALVDRFGPWLRAFFVFQFVYLNLGLLFTYTRAQWIASAIALTIVVLLLPWGAKKRLMRYSLVGVLVVGVALSLFGREVQQQMEQVAFISTLSERFLSILSPDETFETNSLEWRVFETEKALESVSEHPFLGVGVGNAYRPISLEGGEASGWVARLDSEEFTRFTRYIHNSYLFLAVKLGLPAVAIFLMLSLVFMFLSWRLYQTATQPGIKYTVLAVLASFVGLLTWAISHSHFFEVEGALSVGLMLGMVASLLHIAQRQDAPVPALVTPPLPPPLATRDETQQPASG